MSIAEDASTPAVLHVTTVNGTTAPFSPPANSLVVVGALAGYASSTGTGGGTTTPLSCADSLGNNYSEVIAANTLAGYVNVALFLFYYSSAPGSLTVTVTNSNLTGAILAVAPRVLTGAASSQAGAATGHAAAFTSPVSGALTTTAAGSWVYLAGGTASLRALSPLSGTTTIDNDQDSADGRQVIFGRQSAATVTPGAVTIGWTSGSSEVMAWAALEILPAAGGGTTIAHAGLAAASGIAQQPAQAGNPAPVKGSSSATVGELAGSQSSVSELAGSQATVTPGATSQSSVS